MNYAHENVARTMTREGTDIRRRMQKFRSLRPFNKGVFNEALFELRCLSRIEIDALLKKYCYEETKLEDRFDEFVSRVERMQSADKQKQIEWTKDSRAIMGKLRRHFDGDNKGALEELVLRLYKASYEGEERGFLPPEAIMFELRAAGVRDREPHGFSLDSLFDVVAKNEHGRMELDPFLLQLFGKKVVDELRERHMATIG